MHFCNKSLHIDNKHEPGKQVVLRKQNVYRQRLLILEGEFNPKEV